MADGSPMAPVADDAQRQAPEAPTDADGFLSAEQLKARSANPGHSFKYEERPVEMPELGGGKLLLRAITVEARTRLTKELPDDPAKWNNVHTAKSLAEYVGKPRMSADEWLQVIKPWPSTALDRVNGELAKVINVSEEDQQAIAISFPDGD